MAVPATVEVVAMADGYAQASGQPTLLSVKRDMDATRRCFRRSLHIAGRAPEKVTTDGHDAYQAVRARSVTGREIADHSPGHRDHGDVLEQVAISGSGRGHSSGAIRVGGIRQEPDLSSRRWR
jgi:hypothetical protein